MSEGNIRFFTVYFSCLPYWGFTYYSNNFHIKVYVARTSQYFNIRNFTFASYVKTNKYSIGVIFVLPIHTEFFSFDLVGAL